MKCCECSSTQVSQRNCSQMPLWPKMNSRKPEWRLRVQFPSDRPLCDDCKGDYLKQLAEKIEKKEHITDANQTCAKGIT